MSSEDRYAAAGVNYGVLDPGKLLAQRAAADTAQNLLGRGAREVVESRGESAYVVALGDRYLATVTEALGTKNLVADAVRAYTGRSHYDAIARDTVATILNDLATVGARPLCLTAYWGAGSSDWFADSPRFADLVAGWSAACNEAGCAWGGGETQVLTGMIEPSVVVLGGSATGVIASERELLLGSRVRAGDAILVAPATGIHTNGLTLARRAAENLPSRYETRVPGTQRSFGEALLDPTPLYGVLIEALFDAGVEVHYAVNVTGHGFRKFMRPTQALSYVIDKLPELPAVLSLLVAATQLSPEEAFGTFNMGAGFAFYVAPGSVDRALAVPAARAAGVFVAGRIEAGPRRVVIEPLGLTFSGESLAIR